MVFGCVSKRETRLLVNKNNPFTVMKVKFALGIALLLGGLMACSKETAVEAPAEEKTSFGLIQDQILTPSCATRGCHAATSDASFAQHGLVLAKGLAYNNLINKDPKNTNALAVSYKLVRPFKSLESLFYHKLNLEQGHHAQNFGATMPLGGNFLTAGQLEFVRRWIEAGAPETGNVVDEKILADKTPQNQVAFTPLATPQQESLAGFQLKVSQFEVYPQFERELFVRTPVGNTAEVYVNRIKLKARNNSHHMVIYDFRDKSSALMPSVGTVRDLRNRDNSLNVITALQVSNHIFLGGGTDPNSDYVFPEGTALLMPANATVDLNPHYFNKTDLVSYGENYVNLYTVDKSKVKNVVKMIDFQNTRFTLPAKQKTTVTTNFKFNTDVKIVALTSHNHKYGEKFVIRISGGSRDGEVVYESTDWEHPAVKNFTMPLALKKGEGLTSVVTYNNTSDKLVSFGLTSEDEMNIIFGYYYEAP
jgi:Copper type II ascorbate-dependent monooxygenase, C-terminal domain